MAFLLYHFFVTLHNFNWQHDLENFVYKKIDLLFLEVSLVLELPGIMKLGFFLVLDLFKKFVINWLYFSKFIIIQHSLNVMEML